MTNSLHSPNSNHICGLVNDAVITNTNSPMVLGFGCKNARARYVGSKFAIRDSTSSRRVALGSPPQSLGEDVHAESKETEIPRKRLCLTRSHPSQEMDSARAGGFAPHPADAGDGGAIHQSSVDAADVNRSGRRDVLKSAKASASLPLDRFAADS
jgi:hypothetical protein